MYSAGAAGAIVRHMCGRFVVSPDPETIARFFDVDEVLTDDLGASYNVAPTDRIYGVAQYEGKRLLGSFRWGFIPWWSKEKGRLLINARAETVATTPAFRDAFAQKRCLIPADGFFEWETTAEGKLPYFITAPDGEMLGFAGIWSRWNDPETETSVSTAAIITTRSVGPVADLHNRMPVILPEELWSDWLDRQNSDPLEVMTLRRSDLTFHRVSKLVNNVRNNSPECLLPVE